MAQQLKKLTNVRISNKSDEKRNNFSFLMGSDFNEMICSGYTPLSQIGRAHV